MQSASLLFMRISRRRHRCAARDTALRVAAVIDDVIECNIVIDDVTCIDATH